MKLQMTISRRTALAGPILLALCGLALVGRAADPGAKPATTAPRAALTVTAVTPQRSEWPQTLAANGNIAAWQETVIGTEVGGLRLIEVHVNVGDRVRRGQVLARLQSDTVNAELLQTRAGIAEIEATLEDARANAERGRQLQAGGVISTQQLSQYLTAEATARARLASLHARLKADEVKLSQTRIVAHDDGVISARAATVGAVVQPGQELFRLIRGSRLEWRAEVPAADLARLKPGVSAKLFVTGARPVDGRVRVVAPTVDLQTRNGIVYVDLPAPGELKAGMFARGEFELGRVKGLTLPQSAVLLRDGFAYVFRIGADARVTMTKVGTGRRFGDRIEITDGLDPEARVVASGGGFLGDGDTVRVVEAASQTLKPAAPPPSR
jgi:HlyD family secretion protein